MENNMTEISEDKIKSIDYLFNRIISERVRDSMEPKYSLLMGAGCSISSQIVSAKDIINMLKTVVYLRELPTGDTQTPFLDLEHGKLVPFLRMWYEKNQDNEKFVKFVEHKEQQIKTDIYKKLETMPNYYEEVFYNVMHKQYQEYENLSQCEKTKILQQFLEQYEEKIQSDMEYSFWFTNYSTASEDIHGFLSELMHNKQPSEAYILLADLYINKLFSIAFTTNFDNLLAEALSLLGVRSKELWFDSNEVDNTLSKTSPNIVKLHGDYMYHNTKNLSRETRKLASPLQKPLESVLGKGGLIVIGYSGADNSIMYTLEKLSEKYSFPLFWCEMEDKIANGDVHWRARTLVENSENAYFIKIKNFDEFVKKLRENYMIYSKLKRSKLIVDFESDKNEILYDDKYLSKALERIQEMINEVLNKNRELSHRVAAVPPPNDILFKDKECL